VGATLSAQDQHHHQLPVLAPVHTDEHRRVPNLDVLVRKAYKVLLTRRLIGCVIYSTDPRDPSPSCQARSFFGIAAVNFGHSEAEYDLTRCPVPFRLLPQTANLSSLA
jgi:hypothetical protein